MQFDTRCLSSLIMQFLHQRKSTTENQAQSGFKGYFDSKIRVSLLNPVMSKHQRFDKNKTLKTQGNANSSLSSEVDIDRGVTLGDFLSLAVLLMGLMFLLNLEQVKRTGNGAEGTIWTVLSQSENTPLQSSPYRKRDD